MAGMIDEFRRQVVGYYNERACGSDGARITVDDVYVVWQCKTLQNLKALLSTTVPDGMYYELTHDGDRKLTYLDAYKKWEQVVVEADDA